MTTEIGPKTSQWWMSELLLRMEVGHPAESIREARELAEGSLDPARLLSLLGLLWEHKRYEEARLYADKFLAEQLDSGEAWAIRGMCNAMLRAPRRGLSDLERALFCGVATRSFRLEAYEWLGDLYEIFDQQVPSEHLRYKTWLFYSAIHDSYDDPLKVRVGPFKLPTRGQVESAHRDLACGDWQPLVGLGDLRHGAQIPSAFLHHLFRWGCEKEVWQTIDEHLAVTVYVENGVVDTIKLSGVICHDGRTLSGRPEAELQGLFPDGDLDVTDEGVRCWWVAHLDAMFFFDEKNVVEKLVFGGDAE